MTTYKEDPFLDAIKSKGYYSNTWKRTKHFDVDLTVGQNFRDEKETISNVTSSRISLWSDINIVVDKNEPNTYHNNRFFYQETIREECEFYRKYGCECCGRKLILPIEISYGICLECDRRMFSKTRARNAFPELPERNTCCPKEFYKFADKIDYIETHTQTIWKFLLQLFVRNKKDVEHNKNKWHPYLKFITQQKG